MRITIIGAGFSGGVLATELARHAPADTDIRLASVAESFGRGVAYGEARAEHLLNVRARDLGADPDDPSGFVAWLNLGKRAEQGFLPRLAYGEYLYSRLQEALHASRADVRLHTQEAVAVERCRRNACMAWARACWSIPPTSPGRGSAAWPATRRSTASTPTRAC